MRIPDRDIHPTRPWQAQCPERLDIYLRVDSRGVMALVSEQLPDHRQGRAGPKKLGGEAMSKNVSTLVRVTTDTSTIESGLGDHRDRATRCKADLGSQFAE